MLKQNTSKRASAPRSASDITSLRRGRSLTRILLTLTAGIALLAVFAWALPRLSAAVSGTGIYYAGPAASRMTSPAAASNIVLVTSQAALNANDAVMWNSLGANGSTIPTTFNATSTLGKTIGGQLAGNGQVSNSRIWTRPNGGPLTLTFPAVSGVGAFIVNSVNPGTQFTASLAVYNGATLLGTVTRQSNTNGAPIYLGATDTTGPNITRAVYSLTVAGTIIAPDGTYTYRDYDCFAGNIDFVFCSGLSPGDPLDVDTMLQCPQTTLCAPDGDFTLPPQPWISTTPDYPGWTGTETNYSYTPDTNPSNLADFYVASVDFAGPSAAPAINVSGNGNAIANGSTTPSTTNDTDFGSTTVGAMATKTFTIENTGMGSLNLTGTPNKVVLSGTNAADFSVTAQPTSPIAANNGTTTFQVTFAPTATGARTATLSIANDDTSHNPYTFAIQGTGMTATISGPACSNFTSKHIGPTNTNGVNGVYVVGNTIYTALTQDGVGISTDGGVNYSYRTTANGLGSNNTYGIYVQGTNVYVATTEGVSKSTNGGASFTNVAPGPTFNQKFTQAVYAVGNTVYAGTSNGGLAISTNGGASYTFKTTADGLGSNAVTSIYAAGSQVIVGTGNGVSISNDGGATFVNHTDGLGNVRVKSVYAQGNTVYVGTGGTSGFSISGGLSISTDGGNTFTNRTTADGLGGNYVSSVYALGNTVYAGIYYVLGVSTGGISISTDGGNTFTHYSEGLYNPVTTSVFATSTAVYVGSYSAGNYPHGTEGGIASCTPPPVGINVKGNNMIIANGDTTPSAADDSDFGSVNAASGTASKTFTIENPGSADLNLTGTPAVSLSGTNAADFTLTAQPTSPVTGGSSTTFTITFDPSGAGTRSAALSIANNVSGKNPYTFVIQGTGLAPEINLKGNSTTIASGDTTPSISDDTDFGTVSTTSTAAHTFTIENAGNLPLSLTGTPKVAVSGMNAADFSVTTLPASPIAGSGSTTFIVTFAPSAAGTRSATVSIANDDADENPYTFAIQGGGCFSNSVVQNTNDSGAGSLRQAIADACPGSTISFASPLFDTAQTITLASTLTIDKNLTIDGPGPNLLSISGNNAVRVIQITGPPNSVTIRDLTVTQGNTTSPGGGISTPWTLELVNCVISGNKGIAGGGLNVATSLTLTNSTVSGNMATAGAGGGLQAPVMTITGSTISGNMATDIGGGIKANGPVTITGSTISGNTSQGNGGGINLTSNGHAITNSTISGNTANFGGGVFTNGSVTVSSCTITDNTATGDPGGGGFFANGPTTLKNTLIAGNHHAGNPDIFIGSNITSQGYNLIGNADNGAGPVTPTTGDQFGTAANPINPMLGALADNGGPTKTHKLIIGSPAIDKGNAFTLTTDQRGELRPKDNPNVSPATSGDNSDIGAFELQNTPPTISSNAVTVTAGSSLASFTIAMAADPDQPVNTLGITVNGNPATATSNGVTVSGVTINAGGSITANVSATCAATTATFNLVITDNQTATGEGTLTVMVTANTPPILSYGNQAFPPGATPGFGPATATDNGAIGSFALQSITPASGLSLTVNPTTGEVQVMSATIAQSYTLVIRATDNCGLMTDATFTVTLPCPTIALSPAILPDAAVNTAYGQSLSANPFGTTYSFAVTAGLLPAGLTLNSDGAFSGAPTQSGTFQFRVTARGWGNCTGFRDYQLIVSCPVIALTPASLPGGTMGTAYNQSVSAAPAGTYSYSISSGALPPGLTLDAATGALNGTPATVGTFNFTIKASAGTCSSTRNYTVAVACQTFGISTTTLPSGNAGSAYSHTLNVTPAGSYTFSLAQGNLPTGLVLTAATGVISGLPSVTGTSTFMIKVKLANGCEVTQALSITINCPTAVVVSPATLPGGTVGTLYNQSLSATPSGGDYAFALQSGALPAGLSLNTGTGVLSGMPTANGTFNFTVRATGFGSCAGSKSYTVVIGSGNCPTITLPDLPSGSVGQLYNSFVTASPAANPAGSHSYAVTAGALPPGLQLYGSFGLIYGYPSTAGTYNFTLQATDAGNCTASKSYAMVINAAVIQLAAVNDLSGDQRSDFVLWRAAQRQWLIVDGATNAAQTVQWERAGDKAVTGDYDGDGKADLAGFGKDGYWRIKLSADGETLDKVWGLGSDVPVPGDYDGDGKTDLAVWRGAESGWYIQRSSDGQTQTVRWGTSLAPYLDVPVPGDYDGDGKTDIAVFRQANGHWYIRRSSDGRTVDKAWGLGSDVPVPGDYDGDGLTDIAVWRGSEGDWHIVRSSDGAVESKFWGAGYEPYFDVPAVGDYDGDGKADVAVWRKSEGRWYVQQSSDGATRAVTQGRAGDIPVGAERR